MPINRDKNPDLACKIPAAFLLIPKEPEPFPIAL